LLETYRTLRKAFVGCQRGMASQTLAHGVYRGQVSDAGAAVGAAENPTALLAGDVLALLRGAPRRQVTPITTITNTQTTITNTQSFEWTKGALYVDHTNASCPDPTLTPRRQHRMHWWPRTPSGMFGCQAMHPTSLHCCARG
jgi:hypothetical protein